MLILTLLLTAVISYLLGSCNSAIIVVKLLKHEDIREHGSKNAGLTNTLRCYGKVPALLTLIGDLAKGVVAVLISLQIAKLLMGADFESVHALVDKRTIGYISGLFSIIGHIFPLYYGFKGGKGVLVSCSILLVIDPVTFCIVIPFFMIVVAISRYVSLGSILAAAVYPIITFCVHMFVYNVGIERALIHTGLVLCTSILLIYMHRSNIQRLRNGTENKFGSKKKTDVMNDSDVVKGIYMATNRNIALCIIFSFLTCGIYGLYWFVKLTDELNSNAQTKTAGGGTALVYTIITFGIYGFYWFYMQGKKVDEINGNPNGSTGLVYIILALLGLGIIPYCLMQSEINKIA